MARAPTRLKMVFYGSPTVAGIVAALTKAGCLSKVALRNRKAVAQLVRTALVPREGPPMPGPTPADDLESALIEQGYLSDRGLEWARTIVDPA
jgi:hypothetical protein